MIDIMLYIFKNSVFAWAHGTHVYIAKRLNQTVFKLKERLKHNLYYGAIAPDLAIVAPSNIRKELDAETHCPADLCCGVTHRPKYGFQAVRKHAHSALQRAFAVGWATHNQQWGADYFAHLEHPLSGLKTGYTREKNKTLIRTMKAQWTAPLKCPITNNDFAFAAETYIEVAIDLLLSKQDPSLGNEISRAALYRSWDILLLLYRSYPGWMRKIPLGLEPIFRYYVIEYGKGVANPWPKNKKVLSRGIAGLINWVGKRRYPNIQLTSKQSSEFLEIAIDLCQEDYFQAMETIIERLKN